MSIRPSYGRRSVLQVLSDGMSQRPPTGKSCCEEAALNAAEVDRLTREHDELHGHIAEYREMWDRQLSRANYAETDLNLMRENLAESKAERDELQRKLAARTGEVAYWMDLFRERGEQIESLQDAAEQHPTLDRDAVKKTVIRESHGNMTDRMDNALTDAIMALALAAEQRPTLDREAVRKVLEPVLYDVTMSAAVTNAILALALAEEDEQSAEEERIEEQAKALWEAVSQYGVWVNTAESARERCRAAIRAGWTKEAGE